MRTGTTIRDAAGTVNSLRKKRFQINSPLLSSEDSYTERSLKTRAYDIENRMVQPLKVRPPQAFQKKKKQLDKDSFISSVRGKRT